MDTHAVYEGAMRLLAVHIREHQNLDPAKIDTQDIEDAVDLAARTWKVAHDATMERTRTVSRMPGVAQ